MAEIMPDADWHAMVDDLRGAGATVGQIETIIADLLRDLGYGVSRWPDNPEWAELSNTTGAERLCQGVPLELTDEQLDFIGAVVFSDLRRRRRA